MSRWSRRRPTASSAPDWRALRSEKGVVVTPVDGDQPSLLIGLVSWAEVLGLEIIAAGKSSEYDFVFDAATGAVTCNGVTRLAAGAARALAAGRALDRRDRGGAFAHSRPGLSAAGCARSLRDDARRQRDRSRRRHRRLPCPAGAHSGDRRSVFRARRRAACCGDAADRRVPPSAPGRGSELRRRGLRRRRCEDEETWEMLAGKGHVVSRRAGRRCCICRASARGRGGHLHPRCGRPRTLRLWRRLSPAPGPRRRGAARSRRRHGADHGRAPSQHRRRRREVRPAAPLAEDRPAPFYLSPTASWCAPSRPARRSRWAMSKSIPGFGSARDAHGARMPVRQQGRARFDSAEPMP
jgi:hypothetical protein